MSKLTKENYERLVSILASHNASDDLARSMADYFEEDNPLFKRDLFMKRFLLKREVSQKIAETHKDYRTIYFRGRGS